MTSSTSTDAEIVNHVLSNKDDYYRLLNIQKSATEDEVKKAYKKLALKLHPDKNKHPKAEEAFKHVSTAHQTLSDKEKRRIYDRHGQQGVQQHESYGNNNNNNFPFAGAGGNPFAGGASSGMSFNGQEVNLDDFIQEILKTFGTHSSTNEENFNQQKSKKKKPPSASSSMITVSGVFQFLIVLVIMVTSISFIVLVAVIRKLSNFFVKKS